MAKASTNRDRGLTTRSRATRAASVRDDASRAQESDPAGESMMDDEAEQFDEQGDEEQDEEASDADTGGAALPAAFAGGREVSSIADRTAIRTYSAPAWMFGNPVTRFIAESYIELRKTTWPTLREAWNWTLIVIAMSAVIAIILAAADLGLTHLVTWIISPK